MRNLLVVAVCAIAFHAHAGTSQDPNDAFASSDVPFDGDPKLRPMIEVAWFTVDDPQAVCEQQAGQRYPYRISACAHRVNDNRRCIIITGRRPTMGDLGHELRHCFQGSWHSREIDSDNRAVLVDKKK